ncbi:murein biosynthesis integral membrane protein MurJ [Alteromonas mediterranea]|uniref:murein biosynthesis integral membrane protein MurJ n=1 Tax=Alteromonas mediterranea TaxID=314275 RepID=UPI000904410F|nr:murein biosynthesis integral membrane protein MurJ [Alteromonas mediterranea]APD94715.1 murein biosynthesis integral membrane protein MurJ [Alteromonas mediterranea]APD98351.1 murein biosynthesis integral membrane protein MurJ [Alteromonas mediterranea]QDG35530.1 murein biosynthesis integral membrane protein MurJ [Alteromonas mediterranea]
MSRKLIKSGLIVSVMTLVSRVLGLVRDVVVARLMGDGAAADVFFFANKIPNFLRRLFAEGAFAQAFIPVLTEVHENDDKKQLREFVAKISGTLGAIVFVVSIIGVIASPVLAALFGTGWFVAWLKGDAGGDKFVLASTMLKITFPYLAFISLTGLAGAILNTLNKFAVAAFTPVLLNVCIITCAILLAPTLEQPAYALAWGVFIGGIVQFLFQLPFLFRAGLLVKPKWGWHDENVVKVRTLMIPALFGVSVGQINLLFDTFIASFLVTGSISWLYYSDRLLEFPLGLFGIAIATVILPTLSRNHVSKNPKAFAANIDWAFRMVCLLGIPAAVGLGVMARPILTVIFQRGAFTAETAIMASYSLTAYSFGLLSFMLVKVLAPGFYSRQDTKTPVKFGIWCMVANMVFNVVLAIPFGYVGLAIATSMSATLNAVLLYITLHRQGVFALSRTSVLFIARVIVASTAMGALIYYRDQGLAFFDLSLSAQMVEVGITIGLSVLLFMITMVGLGMRPRHFRSGGE